MGRPYCTTLICYFITLLQHLGNPKRDGKLDRMSESPLLGTSGMHPGFFYLFSQDEFLEQEYLQ